MTATTASSPGVSIVIPAWNEEDRLGTTLDHYLPALEARGEPFEIIVVVDGAGDGTADVAAAYSGRNVRLLHFPRRLGKGGAILEGLRDCRQPVIGFLDADCNLPAGEVLALIRGCESSGCVVGSRFRRPAGVLSSVDSRPLDRVLLSRLWRLYVRVLFNLPVSDTQCGAKFFQRDAVLPVLRTVEVTDWAFDVSLLYHIAKAGIAISEVPVSWTHSDGSKLDVGRVVPAMFMSAMAMRLVNSPLRPTIPPRLIVQLKRLVTAA